MKNLAANKNRFRSLLIVVFILLCFQNKAIASEGVTIEENWKIYFDNRKTSNEPVPADVYALAELNIKSEEARSILATCAEREHMELGSYYLARRNTCEEVRPLMQELRNNLKQFLQSSSVMSSDDFKPFKEELFSQLFMQIMFDEFESRDIFTVKTKSNSIGLCTGFINIGICVPSETIRPILATYEIKLMRLFSYIPVSACRLGFNPQGLEQKLEKALQAQGFYENYGTSSIIVYNGQLQYASGAAAEKLIAMNETKRRMNRIKNDLNKTCWEIRHEN